MKKDSYLHSIIYLCEGYENYLFSHYISSKLVLEPNLSKTSEKQEIDVKEKEMGHKLKQWKYKENQI